MDGNHLVVNGLLSRLQAPPPPTLDMDGDVDDSESTYDGSTIRLNIIAAASEDMEPTSVVQPAGEHRTNVVKAALHKLFYFISITDAKSKEVKLNTSARSTHEEASVLQDLLAYPQSAQASMELALPEHQLAQAKGCAW